MALDWQFSATRFSRFGVILGRVTVYEATHEENLEGTDTLTLVCAEELAKGERIVWQDRKSVWHEHIVDEPTRTHDANGNPLTTAVCINSIAELWGDYLDDVRPSGSVYTVLSRILSGTRWSAGTCDVTGTNAVTFYHTTVREGITQIVETFGGEVETAITCNGTQVTGRTIRIVNTRGNQSSIKRFTWTKDLISVSRKVESFNPLTRVYGYGKGEETEAGGYGRRIDFSSINSGKKYVEDAAATAVWGHYDANGNVVPEVGIYVNEECEDKAQLLAETRAYLDANKTPQVTYEADVIDLVAFGRDWEDVSLGDKVTVVDKGFSADGLRISARIYGITRNLLNNDTTVTFGNFSDCLTNAFTSVAQQVNSLNNRAAGWNAASNASSGWLDTLMSNMNAAYDAAGTYQYSSFEQGLIFSDVPLDANGKATVTGGKALNIVGGAFRLADELNADGSWKWRSFGNGSGFTADEINAGTLNADLITAGTLTDSAGVNYWDLDNSEFSLSATTKVGNKTISQYVEDATDDAINDLSQADIFNLLTNNGAAQGIFLTNGQLYINGQYIQANTLSVDRIQASVNATSYARFGTSIDGFVGGSFVKGGTDYFDILALSAAGSNATNGAGLRVMRRAALQMSNYYGMSALYPPVGTQGNNAFLAASLPASHLVIRQNSGAKYAELASNGFISLCAPKIGVATSATSKSVTTALSKTITVKYVKNLSYNKSKKTYSITKGTMKLKFINGVLVSASV